MGLARADRTNRTCRTYGTYWRFIGGIVVLGLVASSAFAAESIGGAISDAAITARIETLFLVNEHLSPFNINTTTVDGVVTLTGSVEDEIQKTLAGDLAQTVDGVRRIENKLIVMHQPAVTAPPRAWPQRIKDKTIDASVRTRLLYNKELKGLKIGVKTESGVVTLSGTVDSEEQKQRIESVTMNTRGVEKVMNNLSVGKTSKGELVQEVGQQVSDEWVEKRVEMAILLHRHLRIRDVDIEVEDGTCILSGTVDTEDERKLAESVAKAIQGVKEVRNDLRVRAEPTELEPIETSDSEP
ncbi:MAG: BON domain-containing protein [Candidatus Hydrogenedentes bacterium]|nr:BON domain-containing protein [Candidatus Hydrogenedentota bacterium]